MTCSLHIYPTLNLQLSVDNITNEFWVVNREKLNNYFVDLDLPYLKQVKNSRDQDSISFDRYPDGFILSQDEIIEYEVDDNIYPFYFDIYKEINTSKDWIQYVAEDVFKRILNAEKSQELLNDLKYKWSEIGYTYDVSFYKTKKQKVWQMLLLIAYLIAKKTDGYIEFAEVDCISDAEYLVSNVFSADEFLVILKKLILSN